MTETIASILARHNAYSPELADDLIRVQDEKFEHWADMVMTKLSKKPVPDIKENTYGREQ